MYKQYVKRFFDIILSFLGLVLLSPLFLLIIIIIKIDDPGPAFFTQKRVGENKDHFHMYKFRTMKMSTPRDTPTHLLNAPGQYITRVGSFLRRSSLDELPQLLNILRGERGIIETTKKNIGFSRVVAVNSIL